MKLSNFALVETRGDSILNRQYFAEVDVTTGALWWKKTIRRPIRRVLAGYWHFVDSGDFTPEYQVEKLARAWTAQTGQEC